MSIHGSSVITHHHQHRSVKPSEASTNHNRPRKNYATFTQWQNKANFSQHTMLTFSTAFPNYIHYRSAIVIRPLCEKPEQLAITLNGMPSRENKCHYLHKHTRTARRRKAQNNDIYLLWWLFGATLRNVYMLMRWQAILEFPHKVHCFRCDIRVCEMFYFVQNVFRLLVSFLVCRSVLVVVLRLHMLIPA